MRHGSMTGVRFLALIVNPRGTSGSGKTELARHIMAGYGWPRGQVAAVCRPGRRRPIAYRLQHPRDGRPLAVLGHYEATSGGCDTVRLADGGMDGVFRLAADFASSGHDVLLEGLALSRDVERSAALAREHELHVLCLTTPPQECAANLIVRRRLGRKAQAALLEQVAAERASLDQICGVLAASIRVERLRFDQALARAQTLLGLGDRPLTCRTEPTHRLDELHHRCQPLADLEVAEDEGPLTAHPAGIAVHHVQAGPD
jgi:predicted kinase